MKKSLFLLAFLVFFAMGTVYSQNQKTSPAKKTTSLPAQNELTVDQVCQLVQAGLSEDIIVVKIKKNGKDAHFVNTFAEASKRAIELFGANGIIITMGAGETNKVADLLVNG